MSTDYGRTEAGTPTGGNQIQGTNFGLGSQIAIPDGVKVTSFSFYAHSADATTKYRPYAYLRSGSMTGTGSNLISAPEQTGFSLGLNTITLTTTYTNSSGATQQIYFGININTSTIDKYIWAGGGIEQPYFANGGSTTPPGTAPAFTSNTGSQAHFVTGTLNVTTSDTLAKGTLTLAGKNLTDGRSVNDTLALRAMTLTGKSFFSTVTETFARGTVTLTGQAFPNGLFKRDRYYGSTLTLRASWHGYSPDSDNNVTDNEARRRGFKTGLSLWGASDASGGDTNARTNNKWWSNLLFGRS